MSNVIPSLVEQSLQFFLSDLIQQSEKVAIRNGKSTLTPAVLKVALGQLHNYSFMNDVMKDVADVDVDKKLKKNERIEKYKKGVKNGFYDPGYLRMYPDG